MKFLLLALIASSLALGHGLALYSAQPYVYTAQGSALVTPTQQQFLTQDALGQYAYGYAEPHSSKQESRSLDGITRGTYSYRDAAGKLQTVDYTADAAGFHVAATNLPQQLRGRSAQQQPADSVEVAAARQSHLAAHEAARLRLAQAQQKSDPQPAAELPRPVADTAEVAAAKSIHLKRVASEQLRNELLGARSAPRVLLPVRSVYGFSVPRFYSSGFYY